MIARHDRFRRSSVVLSACLVLGMCTVAPAQERKLNEPPAGFRALFDGKDLSQWRGQIDEDPRTIARQLEGLSDEQKRKKQEEADEITFQHWVAQDGAIYHDGARRIGNIETREHFGDFEMWVDWKILKGGDSGIFPRNMPQIQIWDREVGSGGLDNNNPNVPPAKNADSPPGEWNAFHIKMVGDKVWVTLNGELIVDGKTKGNYWAEFKEPAPARGPIILQSHGTPLWFRNVFIKELDSTPRAR